MIEELKRGMLFARLSDEQLQRVAARARRLHLSEGQSLFEQDDPADRFFLVLAGQIKLYRLSSAGHEKVMEIVLPGHTFAEALMFLERPSYPVGAMALQPSELISLDARDFVDMLAASVQTCFLLMGDMSQRLRGLIQEIDDLSLHSATCRVAGYLLSQAESMGEFELQVPKQIVASRLSVKPETFSRIMKQLSTDGVLKVKGNRVRIVDRFALQDIADVCTLSQETLRSRICGRGGADS